MDIRLVLIEKEDKKQIKIVGSSGIMLDKKYIITTGNILSDTDIQSTCEKLEPGKIHTDLFFNCDVSLNVVWSENELYTVKRSSIFGAFTSTNINNSNKRIFKNWAIDSIDNNRGLNRILSSFVVLSFEDTDNSVSDLKDVLKRWWNLIAGIDFFKGDTLLIRTVPFGNRDFLDSHSKGIVSNIFGNNSCLVLSDCPTTPGSEGSPVYILKSENVSADFPIGLVLASASWWKGEWVGLTIIADIKSVLLELIDIPIRGQNYRNINSKLIATTEFSLVQICSGNSWGTGILLSEEKGIFVTNSHVIAGENIELSHKGRKWNAKLIFKTPDRNVLDLALIKSETDIKKMSLKQVTFAKNRSTVGDCVFSAGFSLFANDSELTPTLTKGCVSHSNPFMLKTTCSIHPGASGGAILDEQGALLAVIVCNIKLNENRVVYPRVNAALPFSLIKDIILKYIESQDLKVLNALNKINQEAENVWKKLTSKI